MSGGRAARVALLPGVLFAATLAPGQRLSAQQRPTDAVCIQCHLQLEDERLIEPARAFPTADVHAERGFGCLACHGAAAATATGGGVMARPARQRIPDLCGRCHSDPLFMKQYDPSMRVDQVAEYRTSGHGVALMARNDPDVATCVDCHPAHRTRPPSDPESSVYPIQVPELCGSCHGDPAVMAGHGLPMDQLEVYRRSVHGRRLLEEEDVGAPACNDCHGNHGAAPPGVESVERVCGQCHAMMAKLFEENGHDQFFAEAGLPGCATCHGNHDVQRPEDEDLQALGGDVCGQCHDREGGATAAFWTMYALIDSLKRSFDDSRQVLERAENLGMEVSQAQFELEEATDALTKARTAIHAFAVAPVETEIAAGLGVARAAFARGEDALWEHRFRRIGLAASAGVILLLIVGLLLKIRQIENRSARARQLPEPQHRP